MGNGAAKEEAQAAKAESERLKAEAELRAAALEKKKNDEAYWRKQVPILKDQLVTLVGRLEDGKVALTEAKEKRDTAKKTYDDAKTSYKENLETLERKKVEEFEKYKKSKDTISGYIEKCSVAESDIPHFLGLLNDGLLGGTLNDTIKREQLNITVQAFGDFIHDATSTSISMNMVFKGELQRFVTYLNKEDYNEMDDVLCDDESDFNGIVQVIKDGITNDDNKEPSDIQKKVNKEFEDFDAEAEVKDGGGDDPKQLLEAWGLAKYAEKVIDDEGYDVPDDWVDITKDQLKEMGIKGGNANKFVKGAKALKQDKDPHALLASWKLDKVYGAKLIDDEGYDDIAEWGKLKEATLEKELGFKHAHAAKFVREYNKYRLKKFNARYKKDPKTIKKLRELCMRDAAEANKGWIGMNDTKRRITRKNLDVIATPLATFFGRIDTTVNEAREFLAYSGKAGDYNPTQQKAIKDAPQLEKKLKAIELKETETKKEEEKEEEAEEEKYPTEEKEEKEDPIEIVDVTDEIHKMALAAIEKKPNNLDDERQDKLALVKHNNAALLNAAVVEIRVVAAMQTEKFFYDKDYKETMKKGLGLAQTVERGCVDIFTSQSTIRSSVLLARSLIDFAPVSPKDEAKRLWDAIKKGVTNIYNNYMDMMKVSAMYFSFFVKFKSAFQHYLSCVEIEGEDVNLEVAMEYIKRDVKEYMKKSKEVQQVVDALTKKAKEVIEECVANTVGVENFNTAQRVRDEAEKELLRQQRAVDQMRFAEEGKLKVVREKFIACDKLYISYNEQVKFGEEQKIVLEKDIDTATKLQQQ